MISNALKIYIENSYKNVELKFTPKVELTEDTYDLYYFTVQFILEGNKKSCLIKFQDTTTFIPHQALLYYEKEKEPDEILIPINTEDEYFVINSSCSSYPISFKFMAMIYDFLLTITSLASIKVMNEFHCKLTNIQSVDHAFIEEVNWYEALINKQKFKKLKIVFHRDPFVPLNLHDGFKITPNMDTLLWFNYLRKLYSIREVSSCDDSMMGKDCVSPNFASEGGLLIYVSFICKELRSLEKEYSSNPNKKYWSSIGSEMRGTNILFPYKCVILTQILVSMALCAKYINRAEIAVIE
jgi:hypothetical protein